MARSVSIPSGAVKVAYAAFEDDADYFADAVDNLRYTARKRYPSLAPADSWLGREDHVVLENSLAQVTVSEYCGLVAIAVVPKGDADSWYPDEVRIANLAPTWCERVDLAPLAECIGTRLISRGYASNGEQFFMPANGKEHGAMGLGYTSKEQWL